MKNTNENTLLEPVIDPHQKAVAEIRALFEPPAGTKEKEKDRPYFFDRYRGKIKISLN